MTNRSARYFKIGALFLVFSPKKEYFWGTESRQSAVFRTGELPAALRRAVRFAGLVLSF